MSADNKPALAARPCQVCWQEFTPIRANNIYCSTRCKNTAARRRNMRTDADPAAEPSKVKPARNPEPAAMRPCPHCGAPVTIVALLTTPEAAGPISPSTVIPLRGRQFRQR